MSDRFDGEPGRLCVGDRAGSARLVHFFSATHLTGTGRVDISVQLLIGLIIIITL